LAHSAGSGVMSTRSRRPPGMTARASDIGEVVPDIRQFDLTEYRRTLGDELVRLRRRRGCTRLQLTVQLNNAVAVSTLATYESGTRQCTVLRLNQICSALGEPAHNMLERVSRRLGMTDRWLVPIDLNQLARDESASLAPLRRWAGVLLRDTRDPHHWLSEGAFGPLATLSGCSPDDIRTRLIALATVTAVPDQAP
jgi:transcriptional regulator with XRE-family HTH domain